MTATMDCEMWPRWCILSSIQSCCNTCTTRLSSGGPEDAKNFDVEAAAGQWKITLQHTLSVRSQPSTLAAMGFDTVFDAIGDNVTMDNYVVVVQDNLAKKVLPLVMSTLYFRGRS